MLSDIYLIDKVYFKFYWKT